MLQLKSRMVVLWLVLGMAMPVLAQDKSDTCVVYFASASAQLDSLSKARMTHWIKALSVTPAQGVFTITGHTDATGGGVYNQALSDKRVQSVKAYLQTQGLADSAISFMKGYGEGAPVASNTTVVGRRLNRRVELTWMATTVPPVEQMPPAAAQPQPVIPEQPQPDTSVVKNEVVEASPVFTEEAIKEAAKKGKTLALKNILFEGGTDRFLPESMPDLKALLAMMEQYPRLKIEIQGHVCCGYAISTDAENDLSNRRAKAVMNYLIDQGINKRRLRYKGFGSSKPLVSPEVTEEDRQANRRVEIKILRR